MAQHVRMDVKRQTSTHPGNPDQVIDGRARKLVTALVEKELGQLGIATLLHVAFDPTLTPASTFWQVSGEGFD
jgi:hypothetical protein